MSTSKVHRFRVPGKIYRATGSAFCVARRLELGTGFPRKNIRNLDRLSNRQSLFAGNIRHLVMKTTVPLAKSSCRWGDLQLECLDFDRRQTLEYSRNVKWVKLQLSKLE